MRGREVGEGTTFPSEGGVRIRSLAWAITTPFSSSPSAWDVLSRLFVPRSFFGRGQRQADSPTACGGAFVCFPVSSKSEWGRQAAWLE